MRLSPGTRLGPYEILAPIGVGGMGEVYKACDTKLGREVAVKVLPDSLAQDAGRLARFEREAKVVASLNHSNIAHVYGLEESSGVCGLVMELVSGEPVKGPVPGDIAIHYAEQIADALEAAHEKGIVHRDLKPANILVTPGDVIKVLDFGLASFEIREGETPAGNPNDSPTVTMPLTHAGMIMGTAAYMSPEQARGKAVDRRADIWAFGVVLYEIFTGRPLFRGDTVPDILVEVVSKEPDLAALPAAARYVVERCLRKEPRKRWQAIGDARMALLEGAPHAEPIQAKSSKLPWALAGALLLVASAASFLAWRAMRSPDLPLIRLDADLGPEAQIGAAYSASTAVISPDGRRLVYRVRRQDGKQMLASRLLDKPSGSVIAGTEDGTDPFFSPDGQSIGFFADGKLKVLALSGGAPVTLATTSNPRGASWGADGTIVAALTNSSGLVRIPAAGGSQPQPLTELRDGDLTHRWPQIRPGSQTVLFTASKNISDDESASLEALNYKTGERKVLHRGGYFGRYARSGHVLYVHDGSLFALPVNASATERRGEPVAVLDDVAASATSAAGQFDISETGVFLYRRGKARQETWSMVAFDSTGSAKLQPQLAKPASYFTPRFSPDGRRLALGVETNGMDIYLYDLQSDALSRLTFLAQLTYHPVWMPDGKHIIFQSIRSDRFSLLWIRSDGAGEPQTLLDEKAQLEPHSLSPDGTRLAYHQRGGTNFDIWTLPLDVTDPERPRPGKPMPFAHSPASEVQPAFSPDGRWMAYASDESGVYEVYVRPFPDTAAGGKWQISSGGGRLPVWSRKENALIFENPSNRIMRADYTVNGGSFAASKPRLWSDKQLVSPTIDRNFDLSPDGKTVQAIMPSTEAESNPSVQVTFLLNFFDELRRKAPSNGK